MSAPPPTCCCASNQGTANNGKALLSAPSPTQHPASEQGTANYAKAPLSAPPPTCRRTSRRGNGRQCRAIAPAVVCTTATAPAVSLRCRHHHHPAASEGWPTIPMHGRQPRHHRHCTTMPRHFCPPPAAAVAQASEGSCCLHHRHCPCHQSTPALSSFACAMTSPPPTLIGQACSHPINFSPPPRDNNAATFSHCVIHRLPPAQHLNQPPQESRLAVESVRHKILACVVQRCIRRSTMSLTALLIY